MAKKTSHLQGKSSKEALPGLKQHAASFLIQNQLGLHARAAAQFVKIASKYRSEIKIDKNGRSVNGKSIMGILTLAASKGSKVTILATGEDAQDAVNELGKLIELKFGEE